MPEPEGADGSKPLQFPSPKAKFKINSQAEVPGLLLGVRACACVHARVLLGKWGKLLLLRGTEVF